jgi:hypothetical protein
MKVSLDLIYIDQVRPGRSYGLVEISPMGEEVDRLDDICPSNGPMHHEVYLMVHRLDPAQLQSWEGSLR